jgi:hypothetical protein
MDTSNSPETMLQPTGGDEEETAGHADDEDEEEDEEEEAAAAAREAGVSGVEEEKERTAEVITEKGHQARGVMMEKVEVEVEVEVDEGVVGLFRCLFLSGPKGASRRSSGSRLWASRVATSQ